MVFDATDFMSMDANKLLLYISHVSGGEVKTMIEHIKNKLKVNKDDVESYSKTVKDKYFTIVQEDYPTSFQECCIPPILLYYRGNLELIKEKRMCCTIVGSRDPSDYALNLTKKIAGDLASAGITIVSGLAKGIDTAALEAAEPYGKAVAIIGNGLDSYYPSSNYDLQRRIEKSGLILTEYPNEIKPVAEHFPCRNRLLAAISSATIIAQARSRSGTMVTAGYASEMGREIGVFPFRAGDDSINNSFIRDGAAVVENAKDVLELMGVSYEWREKKEPEK